MLDIPLVDDMELRFSGFKYCVYFNIDLSNGKLSLSNKQQLHKTEHNSFETFHLFRFQQKNPLD